MKDKIMFLVIGILIGSCGCLSYFFLKINLDIKEVSSVIKKNMKITENEFVLLNRKCVKIGALVDDLAGDVQDLKVNTLGEKIKVDDKYYLSGGMYGEIGAINKKINTIHAEINSIQAELNEVKNRIGSDFSITGISGKIDEIKNDLDLIKIKIRL